MSWCRSCGRGRNFGDQLGPLLFRAHGFRVEWASPQRADIVTIGSTLSKVPPGWAGTVFGTGLIRDGITRDLRRARVLALRGTRTRGHVRLRSECALGDPGVLVEDVVRPRRDVRPSYELIVPHYVDHAMVNRHPDAWTADICGSPQDLVDDIAGADLVYTSSLHALIVADALGVPQVYEPHPAVVGGAFKFEDYTSAFGDTIVAGVPHLTSRDAMLAVQSRLRALMSEMVGYRP